MALGLPRSPPPSKTDVLPYTMLHESDIWARQSAWTPTYLVEGLRVWTPVREPRIPSPHVLRLQQVVASDSVTVRDLMLQREGTAHFGDTCHLVQAVSQTSDIVNYKFKWAPPSKYGLPRSERWYDVCVLRQW